MEYKFEPVRLQIDENAVFWRWHRSEQFFDAISDKMDSFMRMNRVFFSCKNMWRIVTQEDPEARIVMLCNLSVVINKRFQQYIIMPEEDFIKYYVDEDGQTSGLPASEFFCSLITTCYYYDTIEDYRNSFDEKGLALIEEFRELIDQGGFIGQSIYESALELIKDELDEYKPEVMKIYGRLNGKEEEEE